MQDYSIWIAAEHWVPGQWNPENDNTDVIVTFQDGTRWIATFFTYSNVDSLNQKNKQTGESLGGKYFYASYPIFVDEVSRARIEEVVADLIEEGGFEFAFERSFERSDEVEA